MPRHTVYKMTGDMRSAMTVRRSPPAARRATSISPGAIAGHRVLSLARRLPGDAPAGCRGENGGGHRRRLHRLGDRRGAGHARGQGDHDLSGTLFGEPGVPARTGRRVTGELSTARDHHLAGETPARIEHVDDHFITRTGSDKRVESDLLMPASASPPISGWRNRRNCMSGMGSR